MYIYIHTYMYMYIFNYIYTSISKGDSHPLSLCGFVVVGSRPIANDGVLRFMAMSQIDGFWRFTGVELIPVRHRSSQLVPGHPRSS